MQRKGKGAPAGGGAARRGELSAMLLYSASTSAPLAAVKQEIACSAHCSVEPARTLHDLRMELVRQSRSVMQTDAHNDNIVRAQVTHHKNQFMTAHFKREQGGAEEERAGKSERSDKKRRKRHAIDARECTTNQAMQIAPPPVRTGADFLCRAPDIDVIGDVAGMEVASGGGGGIRLLPGSTEVAVSRETHSRDVKQSLTLTLQEYYTTQIAGSGAAADPSTMCQRHLHAMNGQTCQNSFVINMVMNDREGGASIPLDLLPDVDAYFASVRPISRAEEELFLRAPRLATGERECVNGKECEGHFIAGALNKFTLVEYQNPEVRHEFAAAGTWPAPQAHCIMCRRYAANYVFFNMLSRCVAYDYSSVEQAMATRHDAERARPPKPLVIASFCNIVGAGEYSMWDVVVGDLAQCIPLFGPVVIHRRDKYRAVLRGNEWWYEQTYTRPERNLGDGGDLGSGSASSSATDERLRAVRL